MFDLDHLQSVTRRHFLGKGCTGVGAIALASLMQGQAQGAAGSVQIDPVRPLRVRQPHFAPKAKNIIYMHMAGSPPQQELLDFKPKLVEMNGQLCPKEFMDSVRFAFIKGHPSLLGTPYKFKKHGQSGVELSELLPNLATSADDIAVVRSMYTDQFNHAPAQMLLYTGSSLFGHPSMGAWITYGLGSENQDLPGFVVLISSDKTPDAGQSAWGSGYLPSVFQGVRCRSQGEPVLYVLDPKGMDRQVRRRSLDALKDLNEEQARAFGDPETASRIAQYEMAFRMQMSVPEATDITREPKHIQEMYGAVPGASSFANNCLLARRLVERGVRFVQLFDWGWDIHGTSPGDDIMTQLPKKTKQVDQPMTALIKDLKQRGLLDETLIIWSGEFGRTAMNEKRGGSKYFGRDHHPNCFSLWMAGGGIKGGTTYGSTDELGYFVAENKMHVHDLQATILHLLGMDHTKLTYKHLGLDDRLTTVVFDAKVHHGLIA